MNPEKLNEVSVKKKKKMHFNSISFGTNMAKRASEFKKSMKINILKKMQAHYIAERKVELKENFDNPLTQVKKLA